VYDPSHPKTKGCLIEKKEERLMTIDTGNLKAGHLYVIAGRGPMKYVSSVDSKEIHRFVTLSNTDYTASSANIFRDPDTNWLQYHHDQLLASGLTEHASQLERWIEEQREEPQKE